MIVNMKIALNTTSCELKDMLRKALGLGLFLGILLVSLEAWSKPPQTKNSVKKSDKKQSKSEFPPDPYRELIQLDEKPFWRKPKYFKRLENDRAILVAVRSEKMESSDLQSLHMQGAGIVNRPPGVAYEILKDFSRWTEMSDYIKSSQYDSESRILKLHLLAFEYHAHLKMRVFFDEEQENLKAFRFLVLDGAFEGMKGIMEFKDNGRRKAEISMTVVDEFEKLPLPSFFIEFGLEVVFQKIAARMRSFVESNSERER